MQYLKHSVPMSIEEMQGMLSLLNQADGEGMEATYFLDAMRKRFLDAIAEADRQEEQCKQSIQRGD